MTAGSPHDELPIVQVLDSDGRAGATSLDAPAAGALLDALTRGEVCDRWAADLAERQTIGPYVAAGPWLTALVAAAVALGEGDWWVTDARGAIGALARGTALEAWAHHLFATADAKDRGRGLPGSLHDRAHRVVSAGAPLATHLSHAVGVGWAGRRDGVAALAVAAASSADGADFHNGLNFAAVLRAPTVFLVRGGDGAASAPGAIAEQGVAYGIDGVMCDAADPLAVYQTVSHALERARQGEGPTLIEAVSTREGAGIERLARYLDAAGQEGTERRRRVEREATEAVDAAEAAARRAPRAAPRTLFDDVFATLPGHLMDQRRELGDGPA